MVLLLLALMLVMLIVQYWHLVVGVLVLYLVWRWGFEPWRQARAREAHNRLRHAQARREIDRIAYETARAMHRAAAHASGDVIEGTCREVTRT
jgi:uncharacterized membrane protein